MARKLELEVNVAQTGTGAVDAIREIENLEDQVVALTKNTVALRREPEDEHPDQGRDRQSGGSRERRE